jgi:excisionase family DNA binding protein
MLDPAHWLTVGEACAAAKVSRRTLYSWMNAGKVSYVRTAGGSRRIDPASLWRSAADGPVVAAPRASPDTGRST